MLWFDASAHLTSQGELFQWSWPQTIIKHHIQRPMDPMKEFFAVSCICIPVTAYVSPQGSAERSELPHKNRA